MMPSTSPAVTVTDATFDLWRRIADFPASQTDAALRHLQQWIAQQIDADNVIWIGTTRVLRGARAKADPFLGHQHTTHLRGVDNPNSYDYRGDQPNWDAKDFISWIILSFEVWSAARRESCQRDCEAIP